MNNVLMFSTLPVLFYIMYFYNQFAEGRFFVMKRRYHNSPSIPRERYHYHAVSVNDLIFTSGMSGVLSANESHHVATGHRLPLRKKNTTTPIPKNATTPDSNIHANTAGEVPGDETVPTSHTTVNTVTSETTSITPTTKPIETTTCSHAPHKTTAVPDETLDIQHDPFIIEAKIAMQRIFSAIGIAGGFITDAVMITNYLINAKNIHKLKYVYDEHFIIHPPHTTLVVNELPYKANVSFDALAVIDPPRRYFSELELRRYN